MKKFNVYEKIIILFDFFLLLISYYISNLIVENIYGYKIYNEFIIHSMLSLLTISWFGFKLRHYTYRKPFWIELKEIIETVMIFSIIELAIIAFSELYMPRSVWVIMLVSSLLIFPIGRVLIKIVLIKSKKIIKKTVIIGSGKNALDAYKSLINEKYLGLYVKCFIAVDNTNCIRDLDIPILEFKDIFTDKKDNTFTQFVLALEDGQESKMSIFLKELSKSKCRYISVVPTIRGLPLYGTDMMYLFSYDIILLRVHINLAKISSRILKRSMDILGALFITLLISPLLVIIYFLIKRDGGDVIYGHVRVGKDGKRFNCLKFRTMVTNSQEMLDELLKNDADARFEWEKDFKLKNDPRITHIGKFLRKTSLDELPQLVNVLKGEMSLVGPRPIVEEELVRYKNDIDYYLMVKPGMTGLWQVSGRNDVDYDTRVYLDSWYVKNWSIWNDIVILLKTINVVFNKDGAY